LCSKAALSWLYILNLLFAPSWRTIIGITDLKDLAFEARLHLVLDPFIEDKVKIYVGEDRANYSPYAKGNFCFERVISGWRGALTVLDLRLKK
jgi:hypothetical protein